MKTTFLAFLLFSTSGTIFCAELAPVPGAWATRDKAIICGTSTKGRRNVSIALKNAIYQRDKRVRNGKICCEIDHNIPLELGGANSKANLWAQQWKDARVKDQLENYLHNQVCSGKMPIEDAQKEIASDWVAAYSKYLGAK